MKYLVFIIILFSVIKPQAQYYYNEILANKQLVAERKLMMDKGLSSVAARSYEADGAISDDFIFKKSYDKKYKTLNIITKATFLTPTINTTYFNEKGFPISSVDSSGVAVTKTYYEYEKDSLLTLIKSVTTDNDDERETKVTIEKKISYHPNGNLNQLQVMQFGKIKETIDFIYDENGHMITEKSSKSGNTEYYYNSSGKITDVVYYNKKLKRLLPSLTFDYDNQNNIAQMMVVSNATSDGYVIWKYRYENGLKIEEKLISSNKKIIATIEYGYK